MVHTLKANMEANYCEQLHWMTIINFSQLHRAIESGEEKETWKFFVWHLKNLLKDSERGDKLTIISDRQKVLFHTLNYSFTWFL